MENIMKLTRLMSIYINSLFINEEFINNKKIDKELDALIKSISIYDFIKYNAINNNETAFFIFLSVLIDYWKNLSSDDWLQLIKECSYKMSGLYKIFHFTYAVIQIDFISDFAQMQDVNKKKQIAFLKGLKNQAPIFSLDSFQKSLLKSNEIKEKLKAIRLKFIAEGRKEVEL